MSNLKKKNGKLVKTNETRIGDGGNQISRLKESVTRLRSNDNGRMTRWRWTGNVFAYHHYIIWLGTWQRDRSNGQRADYSLMASPTGATLLTRIRNSSCGGDYSGYVYRPYALCRYDPWRILLLRFDQDFAN